MKQNILKGLLLVFTIMHTLTSFSMEEAKLEEMYNLELENLDEFCGCVAECKDLYAGTAKQFHDILECSECVGKCHLTWKLHQELLEKKEKNKK